MCTAFSENSLAAKGQNEMKLDPLLMHAHKWSAGASFGIFFSHQAWSQPVLTHLGAGALPCTEVLSQQGSVTYIYIYIYQIYLYIYLHTLISCSTVTILLSSCRLCSTELLFQIPVSAVPAFPVVNWILCCLLLHFHNVSL